MTKCTRSQACSEVNLEGLSGCIGAAASANLRFHRRCDDRCRRVYRRLGRLPTRSCEEDLVVASAHRTSSSASIASYLVIDSCEWSSPSSIHRSRALCHPCPSHSMASRTSGCLTAEDFFASFDRCQQGLLLLRREVIRKLILIGQRFIDRIT